MTHFKNIDFAKHDHQYSRSLINDLLANKPVKIFQTYADKIGDSISLSDFDEQKLIALTDNLSHATQDQFNDAYNGPDKSIFTKIDKAPYSGMDGNKKTALQEIGFAVCLDMLISHRQSSSNQYDTDNIITDDKQSINDAIDFMRRNKEWLASNTDGAKALAAYLRNSDIDLTKYQIHRGSKLFNSIKAVGSKLSGLTADKWNPADIFLIKKGSNVEPSQFKNIIDYNQYIGANDQVIGVSLKKGETTALHGSFALRSLLNMVGVKVNHTKCQTIDQCKKLINDHLVSLQHSTIEKYIYLVTNPGDSTKTIAQLVDQLHPKSDTFIDSFPPGLEFLSAVRNNEAKMIDALTAAYQVASSSHANSAPHIKVARNSVKTINPHNADVITINRIIIPLTGDIHILFDLTVTSESGSQQKIKMQLRSKQQGNAPQFIIHHAEIPANKGKLISQFKPV